MSLCESTSFFMRHDSPHTDMWQKKFVHILVTRRAFAANDVNQRTTEVDADILRVIMFPGTRKMRFFVICCVMCSFLMFHDCFVRCLLLSLDSCDITHTSALFLCDTHAFVELSDDTRSSYRQSFVRLGIAKMQRWVISRTRLMEESLRCVTSRAARFVW